MRVSEETEVLITKGIFVLPFVFLSQRMRVLESIKGRIRMEEKIGFLYQNEDIREEKSPKSHSL